MLYQLSYFRNWCCKTTRILKILQAVFYKPQSGPRQHIKSVEVIVIRELTRKPLALKNCSQKLSFFISAIFLQLCPVISIGRYSF